MQPDGSCCCISILDLALSSALRCTKPSLHSSRVHIAIALHWVAVCEDGEYLQFIYHTNMQQLFPETSPEAEKTINI